MKKLVSATKGPQLARIAKRAGVERISAGAYPALRELVSVVLEKLIYTSIQLVLAAKKITLSEKEVRHAAQTFGLDVAFADFSKYSEPEGGIRKKKNSIGGKDAQTRFMLDRAPFKALCRSQKSMEDKNISQGAASMLQVLVENLLHRTLSDATLLMRLMKATTLTAEVLSVSARQHTRLTPISCGVVEPISTAVSIYNVLIQVHPEKRITAKAKLEMMKLLSHVAGLIVSGANKAVVVSNKKTVDAFSIQAGVRMSLSGSLRDHAVSEGARAVTRYNASNAGGAGELPVSRSARAGLVFSVPVAEKILRKYCISERVSSGAPIYLAASLEYICAELLELAGFAAGTEKKISIAPKHILSVVRKDQLYSSLFENVILAPGS